MATAAVSPSPGAAADRPGGGGSGISKGSNNSLGGQYEKLLATVGNLQGDLQRTVGVCQVGRCVRGGSKPYEKSILYLVGDLEISNTVTDPSRSLSLLPFPCFYLHCLVYCFGVTNNQATKGAASSLVFYVRKDCLPSSMPELKCSPPPCRPGGSVEIFGQQYCCKL